MERTALVLRLRSLRKKWRTEATKMRGLQQDTSNPYHARERAFGESNVYEGCANDLDRLIRELEKEEQP